MTAFHVQHALRDLRNNALCRDEVGFGDLGREYVLPSCQAFSHSSVEYSRNPLTDACNNLPTDQGIFNSSLWGSRRVDDGFCYVLPSDVKRNLEASNSSDLQGSIRLSKKHSR